MEGLPAEEGPAGPPIFIEDVQPAAAHAAAAGDAPAGEGLPPRRRCSSCAATEQARLHSCGTAPPQLRHASNACFAVLDLGLLAFECTTVCILAVLFWGWLGLSQLNCSFGWEAWQAALGLSAPIVVEALATAAVWWQLTRSLRCGFALLLVQLHVAIAAAIQRLLLLAPSCSMWAQAWRFWLPALLSELPAIATGKLARHQLQAEQSLVLLAWHALHSNARTVMPPIRHAY